MQICKAKIVELGRNDRPPAVFQTASQTSMIQFLIF